MPGPQPTTLTYAFQAMSRRGLIVRQNLRCCLTCAGNEMARIAERRVLRGRVVRGCCMYAEPDDALRRAGQNFPLVYGPLHSQQMGLIGLPTLEVGKIVCQCLDRYGVGFVWNGNPQVRILVLTDSIRVVGLPLPVFSLN